MVRLRFGAPHESLTMLLQFLLDLRDELCAVFAIADVPLRDRAAGSAEAADLAPGAEVPVAGQRAPVTAQ